MTLSPAELESLHELAIATAKLAGAHIQSRVDNHSGVQTKDGGDTLASQVVTEVDHESQALILDALADSIAQCDLGLLTEESEDDYTRHEKDAFWCIDPIDGTLSFTEGVPGYSVSIALVSRGGTPLIGVAHDPITGTTFHANKGGGAFRNELAISPPPAEQSSILTWAQDRSMKQMPGYDKVAESVEEMAKRLGFDDLHIIDQYGSVLNACTVIENTPALYFKFPKTAKGGGSTWDFAATACLFGEWGMPPTDIHGDPLNLNPDGCTFMNQKAAVFASSSQLAEAARSIYQRINIT
tara:strand:- start:854 stop:1744 length:891 start_codon:yes stop_codon:yes gene_type:complete